MADLKLPRAWLLHAGRQRYSLGDGVVALPALDAMTNLRSWLVPSRAGRT